MYIFGYIGSIMNMIFFLSIFYNKELQVHPFKIFMYISAFEGIF